MKKQTDKEEMLMVPRSEVLWRFKFGEDMKIGNDPEVDYWTGYKQAIYDLFGSKCLPDLQSSVPSTKSDVPSSEPKPAGPKFKPNDKVIYKKTGKQMMVNQRAEFKDYNDVYLISTSDGRYPQCVKESDLESYTEPEASTCTETCTNDCSSQNHIVDTILKDSFRNERRLNIAVQILSGIVASSKPCKHPIRRALELTDALIGECEKGSMK